MKKKKQNRQYLIAILFVLIVSAAAFYGADRFFLRGPEQDTETETEGVTKETVTDAEVTPQEVTLQEAPPDLSANLYLDSRREEAGEKNKEDPLADRQIYFSGVGDGLLGYDTEICLENMAENEDFMMKYVVTDLDSGAQVFETGLIPSGEYVAWIPGHELGTGEFHLNFHISPYYPQGDQYLPLTSANNDVVFTIVDDR